MRFFFLIIFLFVPFAEFKVYGQKILNQVPRNISLEYVTEEEKNAKWTVIEKTRVIWDFERQRFKSICLKYDEGAPSDLSIIIRSFLNGRYLVLGSEMQYVPERFDIENLLRNGKQWGSTPTVGFINAMAFNPKIDPFMSFFYASPSKPYSLMIDQEKAMKETAVKTADATEIILAAEDFKDQKITFHFDAITGFPRAKKIYSNAPHVKKHGDFEQKEINDAYDVKQIKIMDGFPLPLEIIRNVELYSRVSNDGKNYFNKFSHKAKYRYRVNPKGIQINQNLQDIEFEAKIPAGSSVYDAANGVAYNADGMSDESAHESLIKALETVIDEAETQPLPSIKLPK